MRADASARRTRVSVAPHAIQNSSPSQSSAWQAVHFMMESHLRKWVNAVRGDNDTKWCCGDVNALNRLCAIHAGMGMPPVRGTCVDSRSSCRFLERTESNCKQICVFAVGRELDVEVV